MLIGRFSFRTISPRRFRGCLPSSLYIFPLLLAVTAAGVENLSPRIQSESRRKTLDAIIDAAREEDFRSGLDQTLKALHRRPADGELNNWQGYFLHALGKTEEARKTFLNTLEMTQRPGERAFAYARLSSLELDAGHTDQALKYALSSDRTKPTADSKLALASIKERQHDYQKAFIYLQQALKLVQLARYPNDEIKKARVSGTQYDTALCLVQLGRRKEARSIVEKIKRDPPTNFSFYEYYALVGDAENAAKDFDRIMRGLPKENRKVYLQAIDLDIFGYYEKIKDQPAWLNVKRRWIRTEP